MPIERKKIFEDGLVGIQTWTVMGFVLDVNGEPDRSNANYQGLLNDTYNKLINSEVPQGTGNDAAAKQTLHDTLVNYREEHLSALQKLKSDRTADDAFNAVWNNNTRIEQVANALKVPKEMMQAVIFREQICIGLDDALADQLVRDGNRDDSSTGLGQIFARTAMSADNYINQAGYDLNNAQHVNMMWWTLQENYANIYYVGLVLKYEASRLNINLENASRSDMQTVISRYNGTGDSAVAYGNQTILYYDAYKKYSDTVAK